MGASVLQGPPLSAAGKVKPTMPNQQLPCFAVPADGNQERWMMPESAEIARFLAARSSDGSATREVKAGAAQAAMYSEAGGRSVRTIARACDASNRVPQLDP